MCVCVCVCLCVCVEGRILDKNFSVSSYVCMYVRTYHTYIHIMYNCERPLFLVSQGNLADLICGWTDKTCIGTVLLNEVRQSNN